MKNLSLSRDDLLSLRWAVQVAADATIIQTTSGNYPQDSANKIIRRLSVMEERLVEALAEIDSVSQPDTNPTLF